MRVYTLKADPDRPWLRVREGRDSEILFELVHSVARVGARWKPIRLERIEGEDPEVIGGMPTGPLSDLPHLDGGIYCMSRRAVEVLSDFLTANGEILPVLCDEGEYYAYHITTTVAALDEARSQVSRLRTSGRVGIVFRYELIPDRVEGQTIFRLPKEQGGFALVTDPFVERVRAAGLTGFVCGEVWPTPEAEPRPTPPVPRPERPRTVKERPLTPAERIEIEEGVAEAALLLGLDATDWSPAPILHAITNRLLDPRPLENAADFAISLGCLWGELLRRESKWEWVYLVLRTKGGIVGEGFALVPPDRSLAIFPMVNMRDRMNRPASEREVGLLFNMLRAMHGFDPRRPGSYRIVA